MKKNTFFEEKDLYKFDLVLIVMTKSSIAACISSLARQKIKKMDRKLRTAVKAIVAQI